MYWQCSVLRLIQLVKSSESLDVWLGMVPPWKRFSAVEIVPEWVEMIKTEKVGMECGWEIGGAGV